MKLAALTLTLLALLTGCAVFDPEPPTPFEPGAEMLPPQGCVEYRRRGGDC